MNIRYSSGGWPRVGKCVATAAAVASGVDDDDDHGVDGGVVGAIVLAGKSAFGFGFGPAQTVSDR